MKGYFIPSGYVGFVDGRWMIFATENDYIEYIEQKGEQTK